MNDVLIRNVRAVLEDGAVRDADILISNGAIAAIGKPVGRPEGELFDGGGMLAVPGFIDSHIHGFGGCRAEGASRELERMALSCARRGITAFCPTLGPETNEVYGKIFREYGKFARAERGGARFLGLHLEGPFLSPARKGAFEAAKLRRIGRKELEELLGSGGDLIRIMTIAPELEGAEAAVELLRERGVSVSVGHTDATYEEAERAFALGADRTTHFFNAMRPFHHREPGVQGAALLNPDVFCEMILDLVHVSAQAVRLMVKIKGTDRIIAVSDGDALSGTGCPDGERGGFVVKKGAVYLRDGTLYGSMRDLSDQFRILVREIGLGISDAVRLTSTNCAKSLGLRTGVLKPGFAADLNLLDGDFRVRATFIGGSKVIAEKE